MTFDIHGTRTFTIQGKPWSLRPLPYLVALEMQERESAARVALQRASKVVPHPTDPKMVMHVPLDDSPESRAAHQQALDAKIASNFRSNAEAIRWGLRAYAEGERGEVVHVDGRPYRVLTPDAVSYLVAWGGETVASLAAEVLRSNALSGDDLLGFLQPSGS